jgi:nitrogen regulatory protein PII
MKRIEAIIRPHKQALVLAALATLGVTHATVFETLGLARQTSRSRIFELSSQEKATGTGLIPKRMLLLFVEDDQAQAAFDIIRKIAFTGESGDGKKLPSLRSSSSRESTPWSSHSRRNNCRRRSHESSQAFGEALLRRALQCLRSDGFRSREWLRGWRC